MREWFVDRAAESGLAFTHFNGMSGLFYDAEIVGPGVALFDFDNDGDLDVYLVQGEMLGAGRTLRDATFPPAGGSPPRSRLYRNDLSVNAAGTRALRFTDVTDASGIKAGGYGMGVAAADYDNDGWVDLYLTHLGPDQLLHNNGNGTFTDVSARAGTNDPSWSVSASFVDFDRDGWLDLFVGNYLRYTVARDRRCRGISGEEDYCAPSAYPPQPSRLYRNQRDGTFTDVTAKALTGGEYGPALGVSTADFDRDEWIDIFVANDGLPNQLWINQRDGTFKNMALIAGVATDSTGSATASMGVDAGDFDNDGDDDLMHTNLTGESTTLARNDGTGAFEDRGRASGVRIPTLRFTGFGTAWFDADNDGWLDILAVNGDVRTMEDLAQAKDPFPFHQKKLFFRNNADGTFENLSERAGKAMQLSEVGRGAAFGDVDNDGDTDVLVGNNNGPVRLLINEVGQSQHWVGLKLVDSTGRDALGAKVTVTRGDGPALHRRARADGSYASANDPRVIAGLGGASQPVRVEVIWPDGRAEQWPSVAIDRYTTLRQGSAP